MRIALIADLHGNLPALNAVAADIARRRIDKIWCLGDLVGKGPSSRETFDWAVSHCEIILRGNWDEGIGRKHFAPNDQFYYDQLGEERMEILRTLPLEHSCMLSGRRVRFIHGRPVMPVLQSANDTAESLDWLFEPCFDTVIYADIHRAGLNVLNSGRLIASIGSVGNSLRIPMAQYAILECEAGAETAAFDLQFIYLPYDRERALDDARNAQDMPKREAYLQEIATGVYGRKPPATKGKAHE